VDLNALLKQLTLLTRKFNKKQKAVIIASMIAVVALIAFLIIYASPRNYDDGYRALFRDLSPKDAGVIVQQLETQGVKFKIPEEGTISVLKDQADRVRLNLAAQGIPQSGRPGFEIFDKQEFGATDFDQQVKFLRALEGELSATIESLESVKSAKVHIAIPKDTVFVSRQVPPTASAVISFKDGMHINRHQILGIKNLISSAVPKLTIENVRLTDAEGVPLGEEDALTTAGEVARDQLKFKREHERLYETKITEMLGQFLGGQDKVVARVTIEFDFSQRNSHQVVYDPNNVPRSEQSMEYKREGSRPREIGGVPGAVSNIGPVQGLEDDRLLEKEQKSENTVNYEVSSKTSEIKGEFATINRITAAVAVDGRYKKPKGDGAAANAEEEYVPLAAQELEAISSLVKQAIGYNPERKDEVSVSNFEFGRGRAKAEDLSWVAKYLLPAMPALKYIFAALMLLVFYKKIIKPFTDKMMELPTQDEEEEVKKIDFELDEEEDDSDRLKELRERVEAQLGLGDGADEAKLKYDLLLERLRAACDERPKDIAQLLSTLVSDEVIRESARGSKL
jgi:flagellar M-ring protein FliF